jgi:hypothetical protein
MHGYIISLYSRRCPWLCLLSLHGSRAVYVILLCDARVHSWILQAELGGCYAGDIVVHVHIWVSVYFAMYV